MVAVLDNGKKDFYVGIYPPTGDYEFLDNQPAVDGVVLTKNTTKADLDLDKVFQYRGQVASYNKLPTKNRVIGDTYNVQDTGENYAWNGSSWDLLTGTEAVYWRNGALESQSSTLTIDADKNPISNLVLADITDITATAAEVNVLDGITASTSELNILDGVTADKDEINILDGATLTTTELNYVDGVTSSIQTQLNNKEPTITGAATTITSSNLTKNRALISNNSGKVAVSTVTSTELGYLSGATSSIQTQINGKQATIDSNNKLSSDLVDDTNKTHLFVSSTEKQEWSAKQSLIDTDHKLSADLIDDTNTDNKFAKGFPNIGNSGTRYIELVDDEYCAYTDDVTDTKIPFDIPYNDGDHVLEYDALEFYPSDEKKSIMLYLMNLIGGNDVLKIYVDNSKVHLTYTSSNDDSLVEEVSENDVTPGESYHVEVTWNMDTGASIIMTNLNDETDVITVSSAEPMQFSEAYTVYFGKNISETSEAEDWTYVESYIKLKTAKFINSDYPAIEWDGLSAVGVLNCASTSLSNLDEVGQAKLDAKQDVPLQNTFAPTTATVGKIGQIFVDTENEDGYMCVGIDDSDPLNIVYTWKQITV